MAKYLMILGGFVFGLGALVINMISSLDGSFKPHMKSSLVYIILAFLIFSFIGLASYPDVFKSPVSQFLFLQVFFLLAGILHMYAMRKYLKWTNAPDAFWTELLFSVVVGIVGCVGFLIVHYLINKNGLQFIMAGSILFFIIPLVFNQTFRQSIEIPPKILHEWYYPVNTEIEEPEDSKLKNLLVISFEFQKKINDEHLTSFRAKAPADMEFGQLFYYFINDYNERHRDNKIQYVNQGGDPHGWIFYKRSKWYSLFTDYVDAEKTIYNNRIRENDVIICARSQI
ncbi:MAG TPA: TssN family type VI secretion system protein [Puia sp.]|nr:TssN family type VI secretion system protein [Puia sp.]